MGDSREYPGGRELPPGAADLLRRFGEGSKSALARLVTMVENHRPGFDAVLAALHPRIGRARRIGVTGPPGAGKSSLTSQLVRRFRDAGLSVGVVAVDPTSPFTGGALLGDRIRMEDVALDPGVFIRSMATRGSLGGLAVTTREVADLLDAYGFDRVVIETVGVGQSELDIAGTADTSVVVLVPESGDSIQTLKAGVMEIADIFVINKSDRPGADRLKTDLELMLGLRMGASLRNVPAHHGVDLSRKANPARLARDAALEQSGTWTPPVLKTSANTGDGVDEVAAAMERHWAHLADGGGLELRRRSRLRQRVVDIVEDRMSRRMWGSAEVRAFVDGELEGIARGERDPFAVADELLKRFSGVAGGG